MTALLADLLLQDFYIERLGSEDPEIREQSMFDIFEAGSCMLPALEARRDDPDPERRMRIRMLMERLDSTISLVEALKSDEVPGNAERARKILAGRLETAPEEVVPRLRPLFDLKDTPARFYAAFLLYRAGRDADVPPDFFEYAVATYFGGEMGDMRWLGARTCALAGRGRPDREVDAVYRRALRGGQPFSKLADAWALFREAPRPWRIPEPMLDLSVRALFDRSTYLGNEAARMLRSEPRRARALLLPRLKDPDPYVRRQVALFIDRNEHPHPAPPELLRELVWSDHWWYHAPDLIREEAARAVPFLVEALETPSPDLFFYPKLKLLVETAPEQVTPLIVQIAVDAYDGSQEATQALIEAGPAADDLVPSMLDSHDPTTVAGGLVILDRRGIPRREIPLCVVETIERTLYRQTAEFREVAVEALELLGERVDAILRKAEISGYPWAAKRAAAARRHLASPEHAFKPRKPTESPSGR